jgi:hypothetical protein
VPFAHSRGFPMSGNKLFSSRHSMSKVAPTEAQQPEVIAVGLHGQYTQNLMKS